MSFDLKKDTLFIAISQATGVPYLNENGEGVVYTDEALAKEKVEALKALHIQVELEKHEEKQEDALTHLLLSGAERCSVNGEEAIPLREVVAPIPVDGYVSLEEPLVNVKLNRLFSTYHQKLANGEVDRELTEEFLNTIVDSILIVPVVSATARTKPQLVTSVIDGQLLMPLYTDAETFGDNADAAANVALLINHQMRLDIMKLSREISFVLHHGQGFFGITRPVMQVMLNGTVTDTDAEYIARTAASSMFVEPLQQKNEADWLEEDPTPEFMKPKT